jgi:hypothetical protein
MAFAKLKVSSSYPFLAIARRYSASYGLVLSYADALRRAADLTAGSTYEHYPREMEDAVVAEIFDDYPREMRQEVWRAVDAENKRRNEECTRTRV